MLINIGEIIYDDSGRFREELDESTIDELGESLKNVGQLTPIIVTLDKHLIAGRRRIEAARKIGWTELRAEIWEELDPLTRRIVEFDENDKRKQLTWQETARAIAEIHRLKIAREGSSWSARDTAVALGKSIGKVSEDLTLAAALGNERVAGRPTRRGALDTVRRETELSLVRELARRRAKSLGIDSAVRSVSTTSGVIYNDNCRTILSQIASETVDLIIIDPPWGIDFDKSSQWTRKWLPSYDDRQESVYKLLLETFPLLFKVLKPTCHLYCFFPIQEIEWWVNVITHAGFIVRQRPLIWFKTGQPSISDVYTSFLPCYESLLWAYKPGDNNVRRLFSRPIQEAFGLPRESGEWHENQKPIEMLQRFIESSSEPNEVVLDCFAGGASTLVAAYNLGRYYIGVESDEVNYKKACERMAGLEEQKEVGDASTEEA